MNYLKRWIIPLSLQERDENLLRYAAFMADRIGPERIRFVHVEGERRSPLGFGHIRPVSSSADKGDRILQMKVAAYKHFSSDYDMEFEAVDGLAVASMLKQAVDADAQLMFFPWDTTNLEWLTIIRKIVRKTFTSVWLVPESDRVIPSLDKLLVPIDFSIYAHRALNIAMDWAKQGEVSKVLCQHVYLGAPYYNKQLVYTYGEARALGRRQDRLSRDLAVHFEEELKDFTAAFDYEGTYCENFVTELRSEGESVADKIRAFSSVMEPDLLIMGSRGLTGKTSVLLGGAMDEMLRENVKFPLLCLKRQTENRDLVAALLSRN